MYADVLASASFVEVPVAAEECDAIAERHARAAPLASARRFLLVDEHDEAIEVMQRRFEGELGVRVVTG